MSGGDRSDSDRSGDDRSDDEEPPGDSSRDRLFDDGPNGETDDAFEAPDSGETDDPFAALGDEAGPDASADTSPHADPEPGAPADDPFADLDTDPEDAATDGDPFESMDVGDVGEEDVWEALDQETPVGTGAAAFDSGVVGGETGDSATRSGGPEARTPGTGDERVIDKRSYCQQCPHFSSPPETACTHEGTDIVESVDFSRFRVRNCPMVDTDDPAFDGE